MSFDIRYERFQVLGDLIIFHQPADRPFTVSHPAKNDPRGSGRLSEILGRLLKVFGDFRGVSERVLHVRLKNRVRDDLIEIINAVLQLSDQAVA